MALQNGELQPRQFDDMFILIVCIRLKMGKCLYIAAEKSANFPPTSIHLVFDCSYIPENFVEKSHKKVTFDFFISIYSNTYVLIDKYVISPGSKLQVDFMGKLFLVEPHY